MWSSKRIKIAFVSILSRFKNTRDINPNASGHELISCWDYEDIFQCNLVQLAS